MYELLKVGISLDVKATDKSAAVLDEKLREATFSEGLYLIVPVEHSDGNVAKLVLKRKGHCFMVDSRL